MSIFVYELFSKIIIILYFNQLSNNPYSIYFNFTFLKLLPMEFFKILYDEILSFLGISQMIETFKTGDYSSFVSLDGVLSVISPVMPLLLLIEIVRSVVYKKFKIEDYKIHFLIHVLNRFLSRFISIA